jgi:RimJ/RimL family protein N-acetyltransferase
VPLCSSGQVFDAPITLVAEHGKPYHPGGVTRLTTAVLAPGSLAGIEQPAIVVDAELLLRPWGAADAAKVVEAFSTPDIRRWHARSCGSLPEAATWLAEMAEGWRTEQCAAWAIARRATGEVVGRLAVHISLAMGQGEISYWVLPGARGGGVATRAAVAATRWAHALGLHRVELQHSTLNEPSRRVALAAGFVEEGVRRQSTLHEDGWHDMRLYSHLAVDLPDGAAMPAPSDNKAR